jgi:hypothetical protein
MDEVGPNPYRGKAARAVEQSDVLPAATTRERFLRPLQE